MSVPIIILNITAGAKHTRGWHVIKGNRSVSGPHPTKKDAQAAKAAIAAQ